MEKYLIIIIFIYTLYVCVQTTEAFAATGGITETSTVDESNAINILAKIAADIQEGAGLKVQGKLTAVQGVDITGPTNITGATNIGGATNITGTTNITGAANITELLTAGKGVNIRGDTNINGNTNIGGAVGVTGSALVVGPTTVNGTTTLNGPTTFNGQIVGLEYLSLSVGQYNGLLYGPGKKTYSITTHVCLGNNGWHVPNKGMGGPLLYTDPNGMWCIFNIYGQWTSCQILIIPINFITTRPKLASMGGSDRLSQGTMISGTAESYVIY